VKTRTRTDTKLELLAAGVLAVTSQSAWSGDSIVIGGEPEAIRMTARQPEVIRVTAQRPTIEVASPIIEIDASEVIEALNRRLAADLEEIFDAIQSSRIELAVSEVATRG
jgi:hypothetical protein